MNAAGAGNFADDVKCTHGSTTGPVDEEMCSTCARGVGLEAARHLLSYAFAADLPVDQGRAGSPAAGRFPGGQHGLPRTALTIWASTMKRPMKNFSVLCRYGEGIESSSN